MNFELSVSHVGAIQYTLQTHVSHAINLILTVRNWLIGYHIVESEQNGVELKRDRFRYEYASRLNMYLNYYKSEVMQPADNPPVGILLCTEKGETLVKYVTAGLDPDIFVQKYMIELPFKRNGYAVWA